MIVSTVAVADDARRELNLPTERIVVIPEAPAAAFHPRSRAEVETVRERYSLPDEYLVWVGGLRTPDPRKRVAALARAKGNVPLVLVGPASRWARELAGVQLTGAVDDDELAAIYTGAHALVFPSDDEGFGLPPVEALACGTPVAACDVPALREVLDGRVALSAIGDLDGLVRHAKHEPARSHATRLELGRRGPCHLDGVPRGSVGATISAPAPLASNRRTLSDRW